MRGVITGSDVVRHGVTIVRLWGPLFYVRCLLSLVGGRRRTFLELLCAAEALPRPALAPPPRAPDSLEAPPPAA